MIFQDVVLVTTPYCQSSNVQRNSCLIMNSSLACCMGLSEQFLSQVFAELASVLKTVAASGACTAPLTLMWKASKELCCDSIFPAVSAELQRGLMTLT